MIKINYRLLILLTLSFLIIDFINQCKPADDVYPEDFSGPKKSFNNIPTPSAPDYSLAEYWMFLPGNMDEGKLLQVDLFWLNPTTFVSDSLWNMPLSDSNAKTGAVADFNAMAGIFNESCNIYAPYYRQACLSILEAHESDYNSAIALANTDAANALEYYFKHYNNGRKFVLAGHSQGALHVLELLKNNATLNQHLDKMVAAYVVGWSVTESDTATFKQLKISKSVTDTGCIITYNTIEDGFQNEASKLTLFPNSITTNPLSWTTSNEYATADLHLGAVFNFNGTFDTIYHYTSAQINGGLCVDRPVNVNEFIVFEPWFHPGIYHVYDYEFFHINLKENIKRRIAQFNNE